MFYVPFSFAVNACKRNVKSFETKEINVPKMTLYATNKYCVECAGGVWDKEKKVAFPAQKW